MLSVVLVAVVLIVTSVLLTRLPRRTSTVNTSIIVPDLNPFSSELPSSEPLSSASPNSPDLVVPEDKFYVHLFHNNSETVSLPLPSYFDAMCYGEFNVHDPLTNCRGFRVTLEGETLYSVST